MHDAMHHNFVVMETAKTLFFILQPFWFVKCSETFITSNLTVIVKSSLSCVLCELAGSASYRIKNLVSFGVNGYDFQKTAQ